MIKNWEDLQHYLESDRRALDIKRKRPMLFGDESWKFQRALRYKEYYHNIQRGPLDAVWYTYYRYVTHRLAVMLGYTISINCCGPGLQLPHRGTIIINDQVRIGTNCRIHAGVNIGAHKGRAPVIGNNVYIAPGVKIFGDITIADGVKIGANAVVNKSFLTPDAIIVGNPARELVQRESSESNTQSDN